MTGHLTAEMWEGGVQGRKLALGDSVVTSGQRTGFGKEFGMEGDGMKGLRWNHHVCSDQANCKAPATVFFLVVMIISGACSVRAG
jgi:hypothetical protein